MSSLNTSEAAHKVEQAASDVAHSRWVEWLARAGYAAKGTVYVLIGGLAALAAFRSPAGETTDRSGVLQQIAQESYGWVLLGLIALGLAGYALWNVARAVFDVEQRGSDLKGRLTRLAYAVVGISYFLGAVTAVRLLINANQPVNDDQAQTWTARLLSQPYGVWLVLALAAIVAGFAVSQLYQAISANFDRRLQIAPNDLLDHAWVVRLGRVGYVARGIVFGLIALFLATAALRQQPEEAKGLDAVLAELATHTYGLVALGLVALGLIAYGLFALVQSRYRRLGGA